ncbi:regulatory protein [Escherichia coli]|uniref:Regulatory protein n=1 Tax=Escherichia coli TaxID=562 RepID=A0A376MGL9_ECOLX|nr:regulatory protein [Escherichia coli]
MTESTSRRPAYARLLDRAVRILAVRDHSEQELRRKLAAPIMGKNGPEEIDATAEDYERVIAWCMNMAISMTADLLRALCQPYRKRLWDLRVFVRN